MGIDIRYLYAQGVFHIGGVVTKRVWYLVLDIHKVQFHPKHMWYTLIHFGTLWYTLVQTNVLWYILVHPSTLWYILVHPCTLLHIGTP